MRLLAECGGRGHVTISKTCTPKKHQNVATHTSQLTVLAPSPTERKHSSGGEYSHSCVANIIARVRTSVNLSVGPLIFQGYFKMIPAPSCAAEVSTTGQALPKNEKR